MAFANTDLIMAERGGVVYKEQYGNRINLETSDYLKVEATAATATRVVGQKYQCRRYDWDTSGTGGTTGFAGSAPIASDLLLVERPSATTAGGTTTEGATSMVVSSLPAALPSGTRLLFAGTTGNAEFILTSAASAGATTLYSTTKLRGSDVATDTEGGVLYKATKPVWDAGVPGEDIYTANYSPDIIVNEQGTTGNSADAYNILSFSIDVGGTDEEGDLYFGQKNNATHYQYYGDICVAAIQIFGPIGPELKYSWSFHHTPYEWETTTSTQSTASTHPNTYSYTTISSSICKTARKWCRCNPAGTPTPCVGSAYTGATNGISANYGTADGSTSGVTGLPWEGTIAQTGSTYFIYNETSNPAITGNIVWMKTASNITVSSGDILRVAYLAATRNNGTGTTTDDTFWFRWETH